MGLRSNLELAPSLIAEEKTMHKKHYLLLVLTVIAGLIASPAVAAPAQKRPAPSSATASEDRKSVV